MHPYAKPSKKCIFLSVKIAVHAVTRENKTQDLKMIELERWWGFVETE